MALCYKLSQVNESDGDRRTAHDTAACISCDCNLQSNESVHHRMTGFVVLSCDVRHNKDAHVRDQRYQNNVQ